MKVLMKTSLNKVDVVPMLFVKVETKHKYKNNVKTSQKGQFKPSDE